MAKGKSDKDLRKLLRASGVRKKVARALAESTGRSNNSGKQPKLVEATLENFRKASAELDSRVRGSQRSEAAKKAARTRTREASQRSAAAQKGARTRARAKSRG